MIGTVTIDSGIRNARDLKSHLLEDNLSGDQVDSAMAALRAVNPGANLDQPTAGMVLFVPALSGFKASASESVPGKALDDLQQQMRRVLVRVLADCAQEGFAFTHRWLRFAILTS